jgi:hypothetical protein
MQWCYAEGEELRKVRVMLGSSVRVALRYKQIDATGPDGSQVRCVWGSKAGTKQSPRLEQECLALPPPPQCLAPGGRGQAAQ